MPTGPWGTTRHRRVAEARTLRTALLGFAAIALVVGGFVIANTFSMLVGRRTRELALLRAVGLSRRQLRGMVLGEAAVVGLLGGLAGVAVGYGLTVPALLILAVVELAPGLCGLLLRPLAAPLARLGATGGLAAGNAARNPRRTAATASALMISLSVVTGLAIFGHSVKRHTVAGVRRDVAAPLVVQPAGRGDAAIPQAEVEQLARVPGVRAVAALRYASLPLRAGPLATQAPATVTDPAALGTALRLEMVAGTAGDLAGGVFVSADLARRHGVSVGDRLTVGWPRGGGRELPVTGLYQGSSLVTGLLLAQSVALPQLEETGAFTALVALAPGADEAAVRAGLERAVADRPGLVVRSRAEYLDNELRGADLILGVLYGLLALAVVIGILGVVNTLALSVVERTREIGLLRAVGLTRGQLRTVVRAESGLIALVGGVLGVAGGYLLGAMFQRAALRTGLLEAAVPVGQLALALAGLALAGVLAAAWPARRAARTDVLTAIAAE